MCDKFVSKHLFLLNHCSRRYKTQIMFNKAVDTCLLSLKFVPDFFVMSNVL